MHNSKQQLLFDLKSALQKRNKISAKQPSPAAIELEDIQPEETNKTDTIDDVTSIKEPEMIEIPKTVEQRTEGKKVNFVNVLPEKLILLIFMYADLSTCLKCMCVCKKWKGFIIAHAKKLLAIRQLVYIVGEFYPYLHHERTLSAKNRISLKDLYGSTFASLNKIKQMFIDRKSVV